MHTRLADFVLESRSKEIWPHEFVDAVPVELRNSPKVFRGIKTAQYDYMTTSPGDFTRKSAKGANNAYTLWMDNAPEWSAFPKRSKSLICCTSKNYAEYFGLDTKTDRQGPVYAVFPASDDVVFGVCPNKDIWWSRFVDLDFKKGVIHVMAPTDHRDGNKPLISSVDMPDSMRNMEDTKELNRIIVHGDYASDVPLHKFVSLLPFVGPGFDDGSWGGLSGFLERYGLVDTMRSVMDPTTFSLRTYAELVPDSNLEVWTDAECVLAKAEPKYLLPDNK